MKILVSFVSLIAFLLVVLTGPLYKYDIIELDTVFTGFKYGILTAVAALVLLVLQVIFKRNTLTLANVVVTIALSAVALGLPLSMLSKGKTVAPIHDISTDLINPPEFVAIAPLRADAPNPVAYAGEATAEQQRQGYPELKTLVYSQSKAELVNAAEQVAKNLGWELVNIDANKGIVEATDTTAWFGFKDDVVVRINDNGSERLVDIRSKSRVGGSDLGKNAARIHDFIEELDIILAK
ncbi:DUF1499 domain-containing protein [Psychrobacter sp. ANT_H56B]|uniref:DUF1499 domain-containing protein n=1 Tax=Psychrobacter sp. ANT_H56B TaxID=2597353 RepID=UPI0011F3A6BF|nr:DUF1499 domain-containing protein [Psychrobacter sp. ANT_H56B]KAA0923052.1 DUF1499 domain-containing protein [Psychrobacter sp. ANT_H56B]